MGQHEEVEEEEVEGDDKEVEEDVEEVGEVEGDDEEVEEVYTVDNLAVGHRYFQYTSHR